MYRRLGKRCFDFGVALIGLLVFAVPLVVVAVAVLLTSGWPVLFMQSRVGQRGQLFTIKKFRTMTNAPKNTSSITVSGDLRLTPIGKWLRRWKLDELPQLWNVLLGEMSLVGPRPDVPGYADKLQGRDRDILQLRPGITGPATLAYRHEEELLASMDDPIRYNDEVIYPDKVRINLEYLDNCSFRKDLQYLWQTLVPGQETPTATSKRVLE